MPRRDMYIIVIQFLIIYINVMIHLDNGFILVHIQILLL